LPADSNLYLQTIEDRVVSTVESYDLESIFPLHFLTFIHNGSPLFLCFQHAYQTFFSATNILNIF